MLAQDAEKQCKEQDFYIGSDNLLADTQTSLHAYIGYKVTEDAGDAITDMTLLDMKNSHYEEMTYEEYLDKHLGDYNDEAAEIMSLVSEYRKQYNAGSPHAIVAYDTLSMLYVDEDKSHTASDNLMSEYLLKEADISFFEKFIQRGNANIFKFYLQRPLRCLRG